MKSKHCHIHGLNYVSASGCFFCRNEEKKANDLSLHVTLTRNCSCGNKILVAIRKNEESGNTNCVYCGNNITATRY